MKRVESPFGLKHTQRERESVCVCGCVMKTKANQPHSITASRRNRTTIYRVDHEFCSSKNDQTCNVFLFHPEKEKDIGCGWLKPSLVVVIVIVAWSMSGQLGVLVVGTLSETGPSWMDRLVSLCAASFILHPEPIHTTHVTNKSSVCCLEILLLLLLMVVGTRRVPTLCPCE